MPKFIVNNGYNSKRTFEGETYVVNEHLVTFFDEHNRPVGSYATSKIMHIERED